MAAQFILAAEQSFRGPVSEAQQSAVRAFAVTQSWTLVAEQSDVASGKDDRKPGF